MKLALKVEAKKKYGNSTTTKSVAKEGFVEGSTSWNPSGTKSTLTPQVKSEVQQESTSKSKKCFKCQGLGHITFECPNRKMVDLVKEDEVEEDIKVVVESKHEEVVALVKEDEVEKGDVKEVVESNHVQEEEEKSSLFSKSELEKEIKVGSYDGFGCC